MDNFFKDVRFGLRSLIKHRSFTAIAVITLALGIGANTAIFSVVNAVLLRPLPYPQAEQLVVLRETSVAGGTQAVTAGNFLDWQSQVNTFAGMSAYRYESFSLTGGDTPERVPGIITNDNLFAVLKVQPLLGRTLVPGDQGSGEARVAVISYGLWLRRFASDHAITGRTITVNGKDLHIVGVMPPEFDFPGEADLWVPARLKVPEHTLRPAVDTSQDRGTGYLDVVGRLNSDANLNNAQADLSTIARRLEAQYPDSNKGRGVRLRSLRETVVGESRRTLLILFGAVSFVLLIAGANVANLLLGRGAARTKEIAIRRALGATRGRLISQLLTESVLLTLFGGALGVILGQWAMRPLLALVPAGMRGINETHFDSTVLLFTIGLSVFTGIAFGLVPALQASKTDLNESLKDGGRSTTGSSHKNRARSILIVSEVSLSLVLLVGAGLMIKSFFLVQQVKPGFQTDTVQTVRLTLPPAKYPEKVQQAEFFRRVIDDLKSTPGVELAAVISRLPFTAGNSDRDIEIQGRPADSQITAPPVDYRVISPNYFRTMGIPLLKGRDFSDQDDPNSGTAIINEQFARTAFAGQDPLGQKVRVDPNDPWLEIIGVSGNVKHFGLDTPANPEIYVSYRKFPWPFMSVVTRGKNGVNLAGEIRRTVWQVDRDEPIPEIVTMELLVSKSVATRRLNMLLLGIFAGVAMVLAAIGIYGVISHAVTQRTHEIGLRMALGARASDVVRLIVTGGMTPALIGVALGLMGAFGLTRLMASLLFGVTPTDALTFISVATLLLVVALLACYIPARRATRVDPLVALRRD